MTLKLTVKIKGINGIIDQLKNMQKSALAGQFIYPVFKDSLNIDITMLRLTEILIEQSVDDYVSIALLNLEVFTDEAFQEEIFKVLEGWGQNPQLSDRSIRTREKLGVGKTPRNVITGDYVRCFGLGFSNIIPADIPTTWVRQL